MSYPEQSLVPQRPPIAPADGSAIASLILAFFVPFLGIVFGAVSRNQAKRAGFTPSSVANWGLGLGVAFTVIQVIFVILIVVAVAHAGSTPYPTDTSNPFCTGNVNVWPYC